MEYLERVALTCAKECIRQKVGLDRVAFLIKAYDAAQSMCPEMPSKVSDILRLASFIEPNAGKAFRQVPVTFNGIVGGCEASAIPGAIERLVSFISDDMTEQDVFNWTEQFLDIHPFSDGNGRTAFVLYNWLGRTLDNPKPLPVFLKFS